MKKIIFLLVFIGCSFPSVFCQQGYWQQQVNYKITVSLNDTANTLDGYVKMDYYNNSPDTLYFIWMQLWPNAFKNDRTAYCNQQLENGRTDFYFSDFDRRGYIDRLDFKVNGITVETADHPLHQDIIKIILPQPLAPNTIIKIETPFHVKLPYNFSGDGYTRHSFQVTQWYPKPEVYDRKGWHDIPYLSQGGSYNELGNYDVQITVPVQYIIAANGMQENEIEFSTNKETKTLHFVQNDLTDFDWFADKHFLVKRDTIQTQSGKTINAFIYYKKENATKWKNSMQFLKEAIAFKTNLVGEYPYHTISLVENTSKNIEAAAYPGIAVLKASGNEKTMDILINHLTGYSWFGGALAINEREHLWMSGGFTVYYDDKYLEEKKETPLQVSDIKPDWLRNRLSDDPKKPLVETITEIKKDQPIATRTDSFSLHNYYLIGYFKSAEWLSLLENNSAGTGEGIKTYYQRWKFKHPYPEDFKKVMEETNDKRMDSSFTLLNKKGTIYPPISKKDTRLAFLFNLKDADKHNYISLSPAIGYNYYDQFMYGGLIHNYTLPEPKFEFLAAPLYSSTTKRLNGIGRISYSFYPDNIFSKINISLSGATFTVNDSPDTLGTNFLAYHKIVPAIRFTFKEKNPRSTITRFIQFKTFFIEEDQPNTIFDTLINNNDTSYLQKDLVVPQNRVVNQLLLVLENNRVLYPYRGELKAEQGTGFIRLAFTGNYFLIYGSDKSGAAIRFFAGKFFYTNVNTANAALYGFNLSAPNGSFDYTYANYFLARNYSPFNGATPARIFQYQQIMMSDGGLKVNTFGGGLPIGWSDNWITSVNGTFDIPKNINPLSILPIKIPLKVFIDFGTYAQAWQANPPTGKFLYDAGLQLSLVKELINIYVPLFYSQVFQDYNSLNILPPNRFLKTITFSINVQNITLRKLVPLLAF